MKFSQNYGHLSAIYFYCFTHFVEQFLAGFLLLFLPRRRPLCKKLFLPRKYPFRPRRIALPGQNGRITQRSHDMRICYRAAKRACKGLLRLLAHAHSCVDTAFSLLSAFFEQYAHIASGFATTPSCPVRAFAHYTRERPCARSGAPTLFGAAAFALRKCAEPFLFPKLKKRDRPSFFCQKGFPMLFFGGSAF